jgi:hypothetical protein
LTVEAIVLQSAGRTGGSFIMRANFAIAFLLGVISTLLAVLVFRPAAPTFADAIASTPMLGVAGNAQPGAKDILWLVDANAGSPRLLLYQYDTGRLVLLGTRAISYDMRPEQYSPTGGSQEPAVQKMKEDTEPKKKP